MKHAPTGTPCPCADPLRWVLDLQDRQADRLTADHADTLRIVTAPELVAAAAELEGRTVEGIVVPYGPIGRTSVGPIRVQAGSLTLPADPRTVKLVDEHQTPPRAIGHGVAFEERPEGLWGKFRLGTTALAENALTEALEGLRDAFSVELADITYTAAGDVTSAYLPAVALVTVPAFDAARVSSVAASLSTPPTPQDPNERHTMTDEQRARLEALRTQDTITPAEAAELAELAILEHSAAEGLEETTKETAPAAAAAAPAAVHASMPAGLTAGARARHTVRDLAAANARVLTGQSRPELEAALSNITNTANVYTSPDAYAGELWSGMDYTRRFVPMMSEAPLTSYKIRGWRWVLAPEVADYAGDKTAVPSNAVTTEEVEMLAARLAGAHDLDRKFADFGDAAFIASYFARMTRSYAVKSDIKARAALVAAGTANTSATVPTTLLKALAVARIELITYEDDEFAAGEPDWFLVNSTDYVDLLDVTTAQVPAFLTDLGIDPSRIVPTSAVPVGAVMAGVKPANTFYELGSSPIRVEAINVTNGGVDGGVFGYWAHLRNHVKGSVRVNFAAA